MVFSEEVGIGWGPCQDGDDPSSLESESQAEGRVTDLALVWGPGTGRPSLCLSHDILGLSFPILTWGFGTYLSGIAKAEEEECECLVLGPSEPALLAAPRGPGLLLLPPQSPVGLGVMGTAPPCLPYPACPTEDPLCRGGLAGVTRPSPHCRP